MRDNKKGISPVIATVLLIMLAIILAVIILIWVRSFIGEQVTKNLSGQEGDDQLIDSFCPDLQFVIDASYDGTIFSISAQNNGNIPIYGFEVRKKGAFSVKKVADIVFDSETLLSGDTKDASVEVDGSKINNGDKIALRQLTRLSVWP